MAKIIFENLKEEYDLPDGSSIKEVCEKAGVPIPCGEGICGACVIQITSGMENLSEYTQEEKDFLGEMGDERLACKCKIKKGTVKVTF
jgi:ferredoxin